MTTWMINDQAMQTDVDIRETWKRDGFVRLSLSLDAGTLADLSALADEIASEATVRSDGSRLEGEDPVLVHHEQTANGVAITRAENLVPHDDGFRALTTSGPLVDAVGQLFGEPAVLYKEKINFKQPGGAGFAPHQDATAYKFADDHITVMLAIDEATTANGCLDMVAAHHDELLPTDGDGCIDATSAMSLPWQPIELAPGELLAFSSRTPHRSASNTSDRQRRALFMTFNRRSAGDHRAAYYADKVRHLAEHADAETQRVSTIGHFQGTAPS